MLAPSIFLEKIDDLHGDWPREQLVQMDNLFTAAVERAFELGLESRAMAAATIRFRRRLAEESAIQAAWNWLRGNMAEGKDVSASEVVTFVRERCPGIDPTFIRAGLWQRLMESGLA